MEQGHAMPTSQPIRLILRLTSLKYCSPSPFANLPFQGLGVRSARYQFQDMTEMGGGISQIGHNVAR